MSGSNLQNWEQPPASLALSPEEVHVWRVRLDLGEVRWRRLSVLLDAGESARASAMSSEDVRREFVTARGVLRWLAGHYLDTPPPDLRFGRCEAGKPFIETPEADLRFNLSHSGHWALFAFARGAEVGVDVEQHRPDKPLQRLAKRFFAPGEQAVVDGVDAVDRVDVFFTLWCRKEACVKAIGKGITYELASLDLSAPESPLAVDLPDGKQLAVADLAMGSGYAAAVATCGDLATLRCFSPPLDPILADPYSWGMF